MYNQSINDDERFIRQRKNSSSKIRRSKSIASAPVNDTFDETMYELMLTGKSIDTTDTVELFETSFRNILDGSEFMDCGIFEKNDDDTFDENGSDFMDWIFEKNGDDTSEETIYEVVPTRKASEIADTADLFQISFRDLLDGSEFMDEIFFFNEKNDDAKVEEEEDDKMDAAIRMGTKMARRCSCPPIGSYQPFDAADPTTWKKRSKRKTSGKRENS